MNLLFLIVTAMLSDISFQYEPKALGWLVGWLIGWLVGMDFNTYRSVVLRVT